jgi:hypothetical protein
MNLRSAQFPASLPQDVCSAVVRAAAFGPSITGSATEVFPLGGALSRCSDGSVGFHRSK